MALTCLRVLVCFCVLLAGACSTLSPEDRVAAFDEAVRLYDAGDYADAYEQFDKLSYSDAAAARNAALMLRKGQGVEKNPAAAKRMFVFAAKAGMATAAADLGEMLLKGEGEPPNPAAALPWLTMAAAAHHAIAEYNLGTMFEEGNGVPKDLAHARTLYAESAKAGYEDARERLKALAGEPPPLRSSTVDDGADEEDPLEGPSRQSVPPAPPQEVPPEAPHPQQAAPEAGPPHEPSAEDYEDISKPDFSTPEDSYAPESPLTAPDLPDIDPDSLALPPAAPPAP